MDDAPVLFSEAGSWRSGLQRAASASISTCVPVPDSWHALCVPRRAICASRHVPVTWLGGSQEEDGEFIPRQRCILIYFFFTTCTGICCGFGLFLSFPSLCWSSAGCTSLMNSLQTFWANLSLGRAGGIKHRGDFVSVESTWSCSGDWKHQVFF